MNWISFSERKPEVEPKRKLWVHWLINGQHHYDCLWTGLGRWDDEPHDWSEIEPANPEDEIKSLRLKQSELAMPLIGGLLDAWDQLPNDISGDSELANFAVHMDKLIAAMEIEPPPKPDPFEEWLRTYCVHIGLGLDERNAAKAGWDAAIKHAKGEG